VPQLAGHPYAAALLVHLQGLGIELSDDDTDDAKAAP